MAEAEGGRLLLKEWEGEARRDLSTNYHQMCLERVSQSVLSF